MINKFKFIILSNLIVALALAQGGYQKYPDRYLLQDVEEKNSVLQIYKAIEIPANEATALITARSYATETKNIYEEGEFFPYSYTVERVLTCLLVSSEVNTAPQLIPVGTEFYITESGITDPYNAYLDLKARKSGARFQMGCSLSLTDASLDPVYTSQIQVGDKETQELFSFWKYVEIVE